MAGGGTGWVLLENLPSNPPLHRSDFIFIIRGGAHRPGSRSLMEGQQTQTVPWRKSSDPAKALGLAPLTTVCVSVEDKGLGSGGGNRFRGMPCLPWTRSGSSLLQNLGIRNKYVVKDHALPLKNTITDSKIVFFLKGLKA